MYKRQDAGYTKEFAIRGKGIERKHLDVKKLPPTDSKGWSGRVSRKINSIFDYLRLQKGEDLISKLKELKLQKVNINYKDKFENKGMIFSGLSPDNKLPEIIELKNHPWFIGVQFHPEFKSRPLNPHPLFSSFIKAAKTYSKK